MRRADGWILVLSAVLLLAIGVFFRYEGRMEAFLPIARIETAEGGYRIDLNTADVELLINLPGIGEALAGRIVDYRQQNGSFETIDEVTEVSGIGDAKLEAIRPFVMIE